MEIDVFTLFPEWFEWFTAQRHVSNALAGPVRFACVNFRDHTPLGASQVDDTPFGGGAGMLLRVDVVESALRARYGLDPVEMASRRRVIALTPGGRLLDDGLVDELSHEPALTLLCGRYEGFDERIRLGLRPREVSAGDFVCNGGEVPAMMVIDTVIRYVPGVLGDPESVTEESHSDQGRLEYPQYTRPREFRGMTVPDVLLSGNHQAIARWRREQSQARSVGDAGPAEDKTLKAKEGDDHEQPLDGPR
jgi:tRNA (guanine37-N1)-methyltransferase